MDLTLTQHLNMKFLILKVRTTFRMIRLFVFKACYSYRLCKQLNNGDGTLGSFGKSQLTCLFRKKEWRKKRKLFVLARVSHYKTDLFCIWNKSAWHSWWSPNRYYESCLRKTPDYGLTHGQLVNTVPHVTLIGWFLTGRCNVNKKIKLILFIWN